MIRVFIVLSMDWNIAMLSNYSMYKYCNKHDSIDTAYQKLMILLCDRLAITFDPKKMCWDEGRIGGEIEKYAMYKSTLESVYIDDVLKPYIKESEDENDNKCSAD